MSYTDAQIKIINEQAKASPGKRYITNSGKVFIGTENNRLKSSTGINHSEIKKDKKIDNRVSELESDIILKEYTSTVDSKLSELECKLIAMNIVLG